MKIKFPVMNNLYKPEDLSGMLIVISAFLAMALANIYPNLYLGFINSSLTVALDESESNFSIKDLAKDILMIGFFFVIGMELKRDMFQDLVSNYSKILLPLFAAMAGVAAPALIFLAINHSNPENLKGWGIPTATDIAFAMAIVAVAGKSISKQTRLLLLAIAIFDDLAAILIIALFYNSDISFYYLFLSSLVIGLLWIINRLGISNYFGYILLGIILCRFLHQAGIHSTVGGVITGFFIPLKEMRGSRSPLNNFVKMLEPVVNLIILPFFAFVASGVYIMNFNHDLIWNPLFSGIFLSLLIGKQIGIFSTIYILAKTRLVKLSSEIKWPEIYAMSAIAGIGFTMSLFINEMAFVEDEKQSIVKIAVIAASIVSAILGLVIAKMKRY